MTTPDYVVLAAKPTVPQTWHQLGILVLDGSASMGPDTAQGGGFIEGRITKAQAVDRAVREFLARIIEGTNKLDFSIAVVTFDDEARVHTPVTRVVNDAGTTIDDNADYDPMKGHGRGTDLAWALQYAQDIAEQFLHEAPTDSVPHSAVIVVMSDGMSQSDPRPIANAIKQNPRVQICATLFALKDDTSEQMQDARQTLQEIVSSPEQYQTVYGPTTLRNFFIKSVSTREDVRIV